MDINCTNKDNGFNLLIYKRCLCSSTKKIYSKFATKSGKMIIDWSGLKMGPQFRVFYEQLYIFFINVQVVRMLQPTRSSTHHVDIYAVRLRSFCVHLSLSIHTYIHITKGFDTMNCGVVCVVKHTATRTHTHIELKKMFNFLSTVFFFAFFSYLNIVQFHYITLRSTVHLNWSTAHQPHIFVHISRIFFFRKMRTHFVWLCQIKGKTGFFVYAKYLCQLFFLRHWRCSFKLPCAWCWFLIGLK